MQSRGLGERTTGARPYAATLIALFITFACLVLAIPQDTADATSGMPGMPGMSGASSTSAALEAAVEPVAGHQDATTLGSAISSCDVCFEPVGMACAAGFALLTMTMAALLLTTLRDTFLRLEPRAMARVALSRCTPRQACDGVPAHALCVMRT